MLNTSKGTARSAGASLIELMVIVTIAAIVAMYGLPAFTTWVQNTQIRTAAEGVLSGMQLARVEAARRNRAIEFVLTSPTTLGGTGWTVQQIDGTVIQTRPNGEGSKNVTFAVVPSDASLLTFNGFGRVSTTNSDSSAVLTSVDVSATSAADSRPLRITATDGSPRMCDPSIDTAGDPRKC